MKIAIVDDRPEELNRILQITKKALPQAKLFTFPSGEAFLETWKQGEYVLILLDIFMDRILGIDVARKVREDDKDVRLVFCTTSNEFACESYEVDAQYYLHKPITEKGIHSMLRRLHIDRIEEARKITLPDGVSLVAKKIVYTEYSNHVITVYQKDQKPCRVRMSQTELEALLLPFGYFCSPSKGIIVNFYEIEAISENTLAVKDGTLLPLSRRKAKEIKDAFAKFHIAQMKK